MPSTEFDVLANSVMELKRIYLDASLNSGVPPTADQHDFARSFTVLAHAEIEWYIEKVSTKFSEKILTAAKYGNVSASTFALLTFSSLAPLTGGGEFKREKRLVSTRVGEAKASLKKISDENHGIREEHLASLFVPLGLTHKDIDATWLGDVDSFATFRGRYAHMSRTEPDANPSSVNPSDIWDHCKRIVWANPALANTPQVASFEGLDNWLQQAGSIFSMSADIAETNTRLISAWKWVTYKTKRSLRILTRN